MYQGADGGDGLPGTFLPELLHPVQGLLDPHTDPQDIRTNNGHGLTRS